MHNHKEEKKHEYNHVNKYKTNEKYEHTNTCACEHHDDGHHKHGGCEESNCCGHSHEHSPSKFDLIKIDGEEINSTNESYLLYLEENRESYRYQLSCMGNKECITNFDTTVSISLAEVGTYYLSVYCKIISSKRKLGGVKIIEIPFTVYE